MAVINNAHAAHEKTELWFLHVPKMTLELLEHFGILSIIEILYRGILIKCSQIRTEG